MPSYADLGLWDEPQVGGVVVTILISECSVANVWLPNGQAMMSGRGSFVRCVAR
jgi:hypothetical protein